MPTDLNIVMTSVFAASGESIISKSDRKILCFYVNCTNQVQIIRLTASPLPKFERVIFPGQRFMFEAVPQAILELSTETDQFLIPCQQLCISGF